MRASVYQLRTRICRALFLIATNTNNDLNPSITRYSAIMWIAHEKVAGRNGVMLIWIS